MASAKKADEEIAAATMRPESFDIGTVEKTDDAVRQQFYRNFITDSYRLKSELVNKCMDEIGMGTYQWLLFIVAG